MSPVLSQADILEDTLRSTAELARAGKAPVWIFDIDDTLISTSSRHVRILREYAAAKGARWAEIDPSVVRYSITETARAANLIDEASHEDLRKFWFERFFKNGYLTEDRPIPGAPDYCRELCAAGARLVYLTGRDESMRIGTTATLAAHRFPLYERLTTFMFKPAFETPDEAFKEEALARVAAMGVVAGGFENEPAHVNLFQRRFPESRMIFVDSRHSGRPVEPLERIPKIKNFLRGERSHG